MQEIAQLDPKGRKVAVGMKRLLTQSTLTQKYRDMKT
jgi:hypothetical protein